MREAINANMRDKARFNVSLKARYRIKQQGMQDQECQFTNLSASGALVLLPRNVSLSRGADIFMNIPIPRTVMHVSAEAEIMWVKQRFSRLRTGIKFKSQLSDTMIQRLVKKD